MERAISPAAGRIVKRFDYSRFFCHAPQSESRRVDRMNFDPRTYGAEVAAVLSLAENGRRLMPLTRGQCISEDARARTREAGFPPAVLAGLYLYFDCWNDAHETAQDIATPEGSYWHAIVHRQEPDAFNSSYWFRQAGSHAIFPALREAAGEIGIDLGPHWKPEAFISLCERARLSPGSELERQAVEVQRAEWQLLFDYCATRAS